MERQDRRAMRPALERMEERELLSGITAVAVNRALAQAARSAASATNTSGNFNSSSPLLGQGQPTPHEQARTAFRAVFTGPFAIGPGRYSDQAHILYMRGVGGSNFFRHGNINLGIVIPKDPSAQVTGEAVLADKNVNSGGILGLQIVADQFDQFGRPTHLIFVEDPNIYSGAFFVESSTGTVDIGYHGGAATVVFNGNVYTSGLTNPLRNSDLVARGGRLFNRLGSAPL